MNVKKLLIAFFSLFFLLVLMVLFRPSLVHSKQEVKEALRLPESKFLTWRGGEVHYTDEGAGYPLVMVHGFSGSHRNFSALTEMLKNDYRIIRIDLPGFGMSDFPTLKEGENTLDVYREYMSFLFQELQLDSFCLLGNSMGGMVSWVTAYDHPEKVQQLVLLASAGYDLEKVAANAVGMVKNPITSQIIKKGVPEFISKRAAIKCWFDDSKINYTAVHEANMMWNRQGNIEAAIALGAATQFPDTSWIKQIKCPTMIVWGKNDEIVPFEHAARFHNDIPQSKLVVFDSCGHLPMSEKAAQLKEEIIAFVKK